MYAQNRLEHGRRFPFDTNLRESPAVDWAHAAARGIVADLSDRKGIQEGFEYLLPDVRREIVETPAQLIRNALAQHAENLSSMTWANDAANDIFQNFRSRDGFTEEIDACDDDVLEELVQTLSEIIIVAYQQREGA